MIEEETWKKLEELYLNLKEIKCENASDEQILEVEKALDLRFSDFYRYFLKNHQVSVINDNVIFTLTQSESSDDSNCSVLEATLSFKNQASIKNSLDFKGWYIVSKNKTGDFIGVNGKGEVWTVDYNSTTGKDKISNNFERYIDLLLQEI